MTIAINPKCSNCGSELYVTITGALVCDNCEKVILNSLLIEE